MTTSLENPRRDFEVNVLGTINLLEAVRLHAPEATVVYASNNKVYGELEDCELVELPTRYDPQGRRPSTSMRVWTSTPPMAARRAPPINTCSSTPETST